MEIKWKKSRKELTPEDIEFQAKHSHQGGKVKLVKAKTSHEKAKVALKDKRKENKNESEEY